MGCDQDPLPKTVVEELSFSSSNKFLTRDRRLLSDSGHSDKLSRCAGRKTRNSSVSECADFEREQNPRLDSDERGVQRDLLLFFCSRFRFFGGDRNNVKT